MTDITAVHTPESRAAHARLLEIQDARADVARHRVVGVIVLAMAALIGFGWVTLVDLLSS
jgi:hypothetical protein